MARLIIGNVLSLFGSLLMVYLGLVKDKKRIILLQCVQCVLMGAGNFALGAYTGMVSGVTSLFRNIFSFYFPYTLPAKLGFLALQIIPAIFANNVGWMGWLPVASACLFTWFFGEKDPLRFKLLMLVSQLFWCVYDFYFQNYVAFVFDVLTVTTCTVSAITLLRSKRRNSEEPVK